jgi:hypothetical protein
LAPKVLVGVEPNWDPAEPNPICPTGEIGDDHDSDGHDDYVMVMVTLIIVRIRMIITMIMIIISTNDISDTHLQER